MGFENNENQVYTEQNTLNFSVMWKDEKTADVHADNSQVTIKRYTLHPAKQIFCKDKMTRYELGQIMKTRCWDEHRAGLERLLAALGLTEYNPYEICKKTHGDVSGQNLVSLRGRTIVLQGCGY